MKDFVIGPIDQDLVEEFFSLEAERVEASSLEELFVLAEIFPSKGQAGKAGFTGDIPMGINLLGTNKKKFWCWKHP